MGGSAKAAEAGAGKARGDVARAATAAISNHPVAVIFALALLVRVAIAVLLTGFFSGTLVLDDSTYDVMATDMAAGDTAHWDQLTHTLYWSTAALTLPVTLLYRIFGPEMIAGQLYVALLGAGAAALTTRVALEMLDTKWAIASGLVVALLPSQALWSALLMKDSAVWLVAAALGVVVAIANRAVGSKLLYLGIAAVVLLTLMSFLRLHTLVVVTWAMMLAAWAGSKSHHLPRVAGALVIGVTVPWIAGGIGPAGLGLVTDAGSLEDRRFFNAVGAGTAIVEVPWEPLQQQATEVRQQATEVRQQAKVVREEATEVRAADPAQASELQAEAERLETRASELEAEAETVETRAQQIQERYLTVGRPQGEGPLDPNLVHLPRGISVMLLEPFPLPFSGSASLRMARLESLIWYPLLALAAIGLWGARRHLRVMLYPVLAGGGILVTYALTEGNIGTAHRHRGELVWVVAVLVGLGLQTLAARRAPPEPSSAAPS